MSVWCWWGSESRLSFWRKEVIGYALDHETRLHAEEQLAWLEREPRNPRPCYNLARLLRMDGRKSEALALLLEAVERDDRFHEARIALTEIYAVLGDYGAAWRHARAAADCGDRGGVELLERHGIREPCADETPGSGSAL